MKILRPSAVVFASFLILLAGGTSGRAQTTVTWTGLAWPYLYTDDAANWQGGVLPLNDGSEHYIFRQGGENTVYFANDLKANKVSILGITSPFVLDDDNNALQLGAGGLVYAPANPVTSFIGAYPGVELLVDQTWDIQSGELGFYYDSVGGAGRLTKIGNGTLSMTQPNSPWTGGVTLNAGRLALDTDVMTSWTLGTGDLVIGPPPGGSTTPTLVTRMSGRYDYPITVTNAVELNGVLNTEADVDLHLTGAATLKADTTLSPKGEYLYFDGSIGESGGARKLTVNGPGTVVLTGANSYTGGTHAEKGVLIFATASSLPATPTGNALSSAANGYIGFGDDGSTNSGASLANPQGLFVDRFNKAATFGTIGFDTGPSLVTVNTFTGAIDLTGFAATARLGSTTQAVLGATATITPQGSAYRFGGGGGYLQVNSALTNGSGTRSLVIDSPAALPLTVRLTNSTNSFSGGTSVTNSALILGSDSGYNSTIPAGSGNITINAGGYVGFAPWGDQSTAAYISNSLATITTSSVGAVGFENISSLSDPINLSAFTNSLYLATSTPGYVTEGFGDGLQISGLITPAGGSSAPFRFAGYKGGQLEILSNLTGTNGVHIGDPNSPGTFGDPLEKKYSTVALHGDNSGLAGNIMFYAGQLAVGQANGTLGTNPTNALGSGSLVVQGMTLPPEWNDFDGEAPRQKLVAEASGMIIPNAIVLNKDLELGGAADFKLSGNISGSGELYVGDEDNSSLAVSLSGDNGLFTGGIYLTDGATLKLDSNNAAGTGPLSFGNSSNTHVYFNTTAPVIGGLVSNSPNDYTTLTAALSNTTLTLNQSFNSSFVGEFRSDGAYPADTLRIVKNGTGTLRLEDGGMYFYHGTTEASLAGTPEVSLQVNQGNLVLGSSFYIEGSSPTIWVHGGTLTLDHFDLYNPVLIDSGGRLAGNGYVSSALNIGTGATLAPGFDSASGSPIGEMTFTHLALLGGGTMEWDIMKADMASNAWDRVFVSTPTTLDFSGIILDNPASASTRFTLKIISRQLSGAQGLLADFNPLQGYSWLLFNTDGINSFDPAKVILDTSLFANSLNGGAAGNGAFSLSQTGNMLYLNFSPVPEPSTYALMALGLASTGFAACRRRRRT